MYQTFEEQQKMNVLYIYNASQTDSTNRFSDALCADIKKRFGSVRVEYVDSSVTAGQVPCLVLCHNYSRIGTDIDHATSEIKGINIQHVAVAVVHTKAIHALPMTMPTENLTDPKYEQFGLLVDFAFTLDTGLYQCNMNTVGGQKLDGFLGRYLEPAGATKMPDVCPSVCKGPCTRTRIMLWVLLLLVLSLCLSGILYWALHRNDDGGTGIDTTAAPPNSTTERPSNHTSTVPSNHTSPVPSNHTTGG